MCGRFNVTDDPFLQALLAGLGIHMRLPTRVNIAPTEEVPVIRQTQTGNELLNMRWWLTPAWAPKVDNKFSMFNARSESITTSKAFARPFKTQRGIMPASSYIEWHTAADKTKTPWLIKPAGSALAFAAICDHWQQGDTSLNSCAMLTTAAGAGIDKLHHRMPVMLQAQDCAHWLNPETPIADLQALLTRDITQDFDLMPLPKAVGNSRNKDPALLSAAGEITHISPKAE